MTQKNKTKAQNDPLKASQVNSSFTVFFIITTVVWAKLFSGYFPAALQSHAFVLAIIVSLLLYVFRFLLNQFENSSTILNMIVAYFGLSAIIAFVSAVKGPLADGTIPAIQFHIFGSLVFTGSTPVYLTATVFSFYGAVTMVCAALSSGVLEWLYNHLNRFMPQKINRPLLAVDRRIDTMTVGETTRLFYRSERAGVIATVLLLLAYGVLYISLALT